MSENVKISEAEFSRYVNRLTTYSRFLTNSLETYLKSIDNVLNMGINDVEVTKEITDLKSKIKPLAADLERSVSSVKSLSSEYLFFAAKEDKYNYSDEGMSSIFAILSMFL